MSQDTPIPLVPGDDWRFDIQTLDENGDAIDLTGFTVLKRSVSSGTVSFDVVVSFSPGIAHVTASHAVTSALRMGNVSLLTIQVQSPDTMWTTVIRKHINGVGIRQAFEASTYLIGTQGPVGINWRDDVNSGNWVTGGAYGIRDGVYNDGTSYRATAAHTASALNEPGVGADWHAFWHVIAQGANEAEVGIVAANIGSIIVVGNNIDAVNTVAGSIGAVNATAALDDEIIDVASIAAQIVTAASISAQIQTVATNAASVVTVAGSITGLDAIAANLLAVLDASNQAAAAAASAANALTYSLSASAYNDQANAYQLLAANYAGNASASLAAMVAALANVTNYDNTLGQLKGAAARIVAATDVAAACVYDTALDSDPKWRIRARWQSWFWEQLGSATRGIRQFFPKRALIVARLISSTSCSFTLYDLDDSACPMWAVWTGVTAGTAKNMVNLNTATTGLTVDARNGFLYFGTSSGGQSVVDLIGDSGVVRYSGTSYTYNGNVAQRNAGLNITPIALAPIAHAQVNSVAATVLPGTPVDPVRKLPTPTVGVGTANGVSIIHWDNRVANSANTGAATLLSFASDGSVRWWINSSGVFVKATPAAYATTGFAFTGVLGSGGVPRVLTGAGVSASPSVLGQATGLQMFGDAAVPATNYNGAITSTFNTGRLYGSTIFALSDSTADVTSQVQGGSSTLIGPDFVTNGNFASGDLTSYTTQIIGAGTAEYNSGGGRVVGTDNLNRGILRQALTGLTAGKTYQLSFTRTINSGNGSIGMASTGSGTGVDLGGVTASSGTLTVTFTATAATAWFISIPSTSGGDYIVDNIAVREIVTATFFDDFSTYADTVALLAVWGNTGTSGAGAVSLNAGQLAMDRPVSGDVAVAFRSFATIPGVRYRMSIRQVANVAGFRAGTAQGSAALIGASSMTAGVNTYSFVATTTTTWIQFNASTIGSTILIDDIRVDVAAADRSAANNNNPRVVGTLARGAVASGAELAYVTPANATSGYEFDSAPLVAIGTGDFSFAMLVRGVAGGSTIPIADMRNTADTASTLSLTRVTSSGSGALSIAVNSTPVTSTTAFTDAIWRHVVMGRRLGNLEVWVNGVREGVGAAASSLANGQSIFHLFKNYVSGNSAQGMAFANVRLSTTMPTPAQIRSMSAVELPMCLPGAKCLLTGTDNVQGVTPDDGTGLLRVHKSINGTDVFNGLIRIATENMATENELSAEILANTTFDTVIAPWDAAGGATVTWLAGGGMQVLRNINSNDKARYALTGLTIGQTYQFLIDVVSTNVAQNSLLAGTTNAPGIGVVATSPNYGGAGSGYSLQFVATAANMWIFAGPTSNGTTVFDNASFKRVITNRMTSNNHKNGYASNDNVAIFTDAECYFKSPSISLREAMDTAIGNPASPLLYDRTYVLRPSAAVTANATPTVIGYLPMDKGEAGTWVIRATGREYGEPAAPELASYEIRLTAARPQEGNIAVSGSPTYTVISETTGTLDVTVAANTAVQALALTATGPAGKNVEWGIEATFVPSVQQVAA